MKRKPSNLKTHRTPLLLIVLAGTVIASALLGFYGCDNRSGKLPQATVRIGNDSIWQMPSVNTIPKGEKGQIIRYGRELLTHTAKYFGPKGSIARITNGMNCQNCHLDAGGKLFGNNYASFIASYPKKGNRSGRLETPADRIIQCFERSLSGQSPDTAGHEVQAMLAYLKWAGQGVKPGKKLFGSASGKLPFLPVAASPVKGKLVYSAQCQRCHGADGAGILAANDTVFTFPPLWGKHSYNDGAGMYRIGNLAAFIKNNMPQGITYKNPKLTNQEAWDVAAFIISQPRPHRDQRSDWPDLNLKPIDAPFGPYIDNFTATQHKYGPFGPIVKAQEALRRNDKINKI
ncbi:c-type cytochrome [Mucilaginibacter sp.]|uniref:c-type cytochrome n=1 Tax=Mucilaginibacter sp. TaxID=1882438 RepID=UPI0035BC8C89